MRLFRFFFTILFLTATFIISLADNIKISGRVRDEENKPLEFATIRIKGTSIGTNTDIEGKYSITVARKDTIDILFSYTGYKPINRRLIDPKEDVTVNVQLFPEEIILNEVEISGSQNVVNGMQSLNMDAYRLSPDVAGGSVENLLTTLPGVNSSNELSNQYSVRGGSYDENSVYINGQEVYRPQLIRNGQQEGLSIINPDLVDNIKFSSGGFPARYGDKMSSALDITYRNPEKFESAITLSLLGASLAVGSNTGIFSQLHGIRYKQNNSLLSSLETRGEYDPKFFDYQTNLTLKASEKFSLNFIGNIALDNFGFKPSDRETSFGTADDIKHFKVYFDGSENDKFETYFGSLSLKYRHSRTSEIQLQIGGFLTNEFVSYDISGEYWLDEAGSSGNGNGGGELGIGKYMEHSRNRLKASVISAAINGNTIIGKNHISYGVSFSHQNFRDRTKEWEWRDSAGYSLPTGPDGLHLFYNLSANNSISSNRLAVFAEDAIYLESEKAFITLNAGVRASYWDFNNEFLLSPRVNLSITPVNNVRWTFRIASGIYYQSPFYKEYRMNVMDDLNNGYILLNDKIKSPRSIQVVAGTDYTFRTFNRPFKISAELYYKNLHNFISYEYDNLKVTYSGINDSHGFIAGLDFRIFGQFVPGADSWFSLALMKTQQTLNGKKVPLPTDQRYALSLYFTDYFPKFPKLKFSLRGILSDGLTLTPPRVTRDQAYFRTPSYKRVDIGVNYYIVDGEFEGVRKRNFLRFFRSLSVGIDLFNLFDISNVSSYYWVTDVNNLQYAVPNYLTRRQLNFKISASF